MATLYNLNGGRNRRQLNSICGSSVYMAPEIMILKEQNGLGTTVYDGEAVDVWSVGIILSVMLLGATPDWTSTNDLPLKLNLWKKYCFEKTQQHEQIGELIDLMLQIDPSKRISIKNIKKHPFLNQSEFLDDRMQIIPGMENVMIRYIQEHALKTQVAVRQVKNWEDFAFSQPEAVFRVKIVDPHKNKQQQQPSSSTIACQGIESFSQPSISQECLPQEVFTALSQSMEGIGDEYRVS